MRFWGARGVLVLLGRLPIAPIAGHERGSGGGGIKPRLRLRETDEFACKRMPFVVGRAPVVKLDLDVGRGHSGEPATLPGKHFC